MSTDSLEFFIPSEIFPSREPMIGMLISEPVGHKQCELKAPRSIQRLVTPKFREQRVQADRKSNLLLADRGGRDEETRNTGHGVQRCTAAGKGLSR